MLRIPAVAVALFFIATSSNLYALGLGEIHMQSALNQPLNALVDMTAAAGTDLSQVKVALASQEAHRRIGLSRTNVLANFSFSVERDSQGDAVVRVTSTEAIHEPFLQFLLVLEWSNGRLLREYTILVDPPVTMPAKPVVPAVPVIRTPAPVAAVQAPAPQPDPAPPRPSARAPETPARQVAAPPVRTALDTYGPIKRSETLWQVAERLRPGTDISMNQMMLALLRENPDAFVDNNINHLKAGATLSVPTRDEILSVSVSEAGAEARRQYEEWKAARSAPVKQTAQAAPVTESRLQLMAPEADAVAGAAAPGDPGLSREESSAEDIQQQLALASEEAEAGKAQSAELQSRVNELEEQIGTMKRLLELKDNALADLQQSVTVTVEDAGTEGDIADAGAVTDEAMEQDEVMVDQSGSEALAADPEIEKTAGTAEEETVPRGIVNKLMDNPVLAVLGVLVAMLLGGVLWASVRQKGQQGAFTDEMTLEKQLAAEPANKTTAPSISVNEPEADDFSDPDAVQGSAESDALTEADVYLAYGRIQQAEDVLQAALEKHPGDRELSVKLLDVFHAGGNVTAFDRVASDLRKDVPEDDVQWLRVAAMGYALSPDNQLYRAGASETPEDVDFDMDLSGLDDLSGRADPDADTSLDDLGLDLPAEGDEYKPIEFDEASTDHENDTEGLLQNADEVATKLDLARAYLDMGDPEGARSILSEVIDEGDAEQKSEAEALIQQIA